MLTTHIKDPQLSAGACVIWMHGLGADASDMAGLADQLTPSLPLRHVFIDAPVRPVTINAGMMMRAWYDILDLSFLGREDKEGILRTQTQLLEVIESQLSAGFNASQLVLAGFSQGGAMALYTALHSNLPLAGVISLSSYLPIASECKPVLAKHTPIFLGAGEFDPLVLPAWTQISADWLVAQGYAQTVLRHYPMEHAICREEMNDMTSWLSTHLKGVKSV